MFTMFFETIVSFKENLVFACLSCTSSVLMSTKRGLQRSDEHAGASRGSNSSAFDSGSAMNETEFDRQLHHMLHHQLPDLDGFSWIYSINLNDLANFLFRTSIVPAISPFDQRLSTWRCVTTQCCAVTLVWTISLNGNRLVTRQLMWQLSHRFFHKNDDQKSPSSNQKTWCPWKAGWFCSRSSRLSSNKTMELMLFALSPRKSSLRNEASSTRSRSVAGSKASRWDLCFFLVSAPRNLRWTKKTSAKLNDFRMLYGV